MNFICPLCNGLMETRATCTKCKKYMKDVGPLVDYLDEYSPYLSKDLTQLVDGVDHFQCLHILECEQCRNDKKIIVNMVSI